MRWRPKLVEDNPLLLIAMNARNRNLILTTNQLDAVSYYLVATLRLLLSDPLFFLIGYWYGDTALTWMEQRTKSFGTMVREWEHWFSKAAYPLVFIAPNNVICLFAGAAGMRVSVFFLLNFTGTITRLYLIRRLGEAFERPIDAVLDFIARYRAPLLVVSITFFTIVMVRELRQGRDDLEDLEDAIEEDDRRARVEVRDLGLRQRAVEHVAVERPRIGEGEAAPERLGIEVGAEPVAEVDRQRQAVADDHDRGTRRRRQCASVTAAAMRAATSPWVSQPSSSSPRR